MNKLLFRSPLFYSFSNYYKVPYNINKQQHASYLKKVQRAQQQLTTNTSTKLIPRRKRRLYDRPRIDDNITGYGAWRVFQQQQLISKPNQHSMQVMKIKLQPKWLVHAFGIGGLPYTNIKSANKQYHFQDNRFNLFCLYEYRNTTSYKANKQGYDYQHQKHLHPRVRIVRRLQPEQFWNSQRSYQFRVNFSLYAERFKFKKWLLSEIYQRRKGKSYDLIIDQKYGKAVSFTSKQQSVRFQTNQPMVSKVAPQHFNVGENTGKKGKKAEEQQPKIKLGSKLDEKYRIKEKLTLEESHKQNQASQAAK